MAELEMRRLQDLIEERFEDADCTRSGNVLTIELESGAEVVINIQTPMREIWLASHLGGLHFAPQEGGWICTRGGSTLEASAVSAVEALLAR